MISQEHRKHLAESGIDAAYARRLGMRSTERGSLEIPYFDLTGKPIKFKRWRLFNSERKYTQPKNSDPRFYFPRFPEGTKRSWRRIAVDTSKPILVTEGEKKAASAALHGLACIGLGGVWNWLSDGKPISDWQLVQWRDRRVEIVFDSDCTHPQKIDVRRATVRLADYLASLGAEVTVRILPTLEGADKTGLDDFLVARGPAELDAIERHALDGKLIQKWREELGSCPLPDFDLTPVPLEWLNEPPKPVEYLWEPLIPQGTVAVLNGPGGVGKTYLTLGLAAHVACGAKFLGRTTRAGTVVYIALEDPPEILRRRIYALRKHFAAQLQKAELHKRLVPVSLVGKQLQFVELRRGTITQTSALAELVEKLRALDPALVVLDPMARLHGADENANATGTAVINAAEHIARELGCSVLISHHTGKDSATRRREDAYAARGASGIADAARVVLNLYTVDDPAQSFVVPDDEGKPDYLRLIHAKNNYGPRVDDIWLRRSGDGVLEAFTPEFRKGPRDYDAWLGSLRKWAKSTPEFTVNNVVSAREQIAKAFSKGATTQLIEEAVKRGDVAPTGRQRNGGVLYEVRRTKEKA